MKRYNSANDDNFTQCGTFFREVLSQEERQRLVDNIASHLCNAQKFLQVPSTFFHFVDVEEHITFDKIILLQERAVKNFGNADKQFGQMLRTRLEFYANDKVEKPTSKV